MTIWSSYPLDRDPIKLPLHYLYDQLCQQYMIVTDIQTVIFVDFLAMDAGEKFKAAQHWEDKLQDWYKSLPQKYRVDHADLIVAPMTVDLA